MYGTDLVSFAFIAGGLSLIATQLHMHRNGGLVFWRIGRLGGSFYVATARSTEL